MMTESNNGNDVNPEEEVCSDPLQINTETDTGLDKDENIPIYIHFEPKLPTKIESDKNYDKTGNNFNQFNI